MEQNNLNALKERLEGRKKILDSLNAKGRADAISFHYFNREFTMPVEQPEKYQSVVDAFKACLEADIADFEKLVAEGEASVKKFAEEKAELLKKEDEAKLKLAEEVKQRQVVEVEQKAELDKKRKDQEDRLREAQIAQQNEVLKQEQLKTKLLEADLAAKQTALKKEK